MAGQTITRQVGTVLPDAPTDDCFFAWPPVGDPRFARLLGQDAWRRLPPAVRARFSHRYGPGVAVTYAGTVESCRRSPLGWMMAQLCRCIGAPLPLSDATGVAAIVTVTEETGGRGQVWSRIYARPSGFPQVIHSAKRFAGETGLEEYLGGGLGIALRVEADCTGIVFRSDHYFLIALSRRWKLPRWLAPGAMSVTHRELGSGAFAFTLELRHPWFGQLIHQHCHFRDQVTVH
jgi:Domain of unknown function (DUF4166)